jgi:hypothetical protein
MWKEEMHALPQGLEDVEGQTIAEHASWTAMKKLDFKLTLNLLSMPGLLRI